jgi:hypothetical protein
MLGLQLEKYMWVGALETGVIAEVTRAGYQQGTTIDEALFVRADVRGGYEFWIVPGFHLGAALGIGIGNPVFNEDDPKLGSMRLSFVSEVNIRSRLAQHLGLWGELALGTRLGEAHMVSATPELTTEKRLTQLYLALRLWFRVG